MPREVVESILLGTAGLWAAVLAALVLAATRRPDHAGQTRRVAAAAAIAIAIQAAHAAEELATGFHTRFPVLLGLAPWPAAFFVTLNAAWLVVWIGSLRWVGRHRPAAWFALWFLGIAGAANGAAHPMLALWTGAYFPGLATSPLTGIAGLLLLHRLVSATSRTPGRPGSGRVVTS